MIKTIKKILFITIFLSLNLAGAAYSETIEFPSGCCKYEGEVKKGKAHGIGVMTFQNGAVYEGKFSKNRIHGKGKLTLIDGEVHEGKWRYGKFKNKIDKNTRQIITLNTKGRFFWESFEMKGEGSARNKWFAAEKKDGSYSYTAKGKQEMDKAQKSGNDGPGASSDGGGGGGGSGC